MVLSARPISSQCGLCPLCSCAGLLPKLAGGSSAFAFRASRALPILTLPDQPTQGSPHSAHGPGPHFRPQSCPPLPQRCYSKDSLQHSKALPCPVMGEAGPTYRPMSPSWPWTVPFPVPSEMATALPALLLAGVLRRTQVLAVRIWQSLMSARSMIRKNIPNSQGYFFPLVYWFVKRFCERSGKIAVAQYSEIREISKDNKGTTVQWSCTVSLVYKCCRLRNHHLSTPEYACQNWGCSSVFMIRWHQQEASGYLISPDTTVGACVPFKPIFWENVVTGWSFYVRSVLWGKTSSSLWTCTARFVAQQLGEMHALL